MVNKDNRRKRSVCEMSMLLVANIISLSSVRFAGLCFTTNLPPEDETHVFPVAKGNTTSAAKLSNKSQRSQEPERTKKARSYLVKPEKEGPTFVRQEINDVNVSAENYIGQIRGKIGKDANTATTSTTSSAKRYYSSSRV